MSETYISVLNTQQCGAHKRSGQLLKISIKCTFNLFISQKVAMIKTNIQPSYVCVLKI